MKTLAPSSQREKILIIVLIFAVAIGGYLVLRVKALQLNHTVTVEQFDSSHSKLKSTRPLRPDSNDAASLREKLVSLQSKFDREQKTLTGFKNSFINLNSSDAIASMRKNMTTLAEKTQLKVLSIRSSNLALDTLASVKTQEGEKTLDRPLFDIKLSGQFFDINQFIHELKTLPYTVVVTKLALTSKLSTESSGAYAQANTPLLAFFTLAF